VNPVTATVSYTLSEHQFLQISNLVKGLCGINLHEGKKELVKARLSKRLRILGLTNFADYLDYIRDDSSGMELTLMVDSLSTNLTSFFREMEHFNHLTDKVVKSPLHLSTRRLRVWSAGCSSGEEPYSIAISLCESISDIMKWDVRILATDISTRMLNRAKQGVYSPDRLDKMPRHLRSRYFTPIKLLEGTVFQVSNQLRSLVHFGWLNLMNPWPMKGLFDVIFCRNVMIYFDKPTQNKLVRRLFDILAPGGMLFIGHSESLAGVEHAFRYVIPTVYEKA